MKFLKVFFFCLCVASCAPIYVNYDYEKSTNFAVYKTYGFYDNIESGLSELDTRRLVFAIKEKLNTLGLTLSDNPDFYIDIKSIEYAEQPQNSVGIGLGGGGTIGGGISVGIPIRSKRLLRTITINFVDETKNGLFWQAKSESTYNTNSAPEKRELILTALVEKILKKYPPKT